MKPQMKKEIINESLVLYSKTLEESLDLSLSLPDYCSDIKRILKCTAEPGILSSSLKGGKLSFTVSVTVRLVYVGEDDKIDCYETVSDMAFSAEVPDTAENPFITADVKSDYLNCRALSQRKVALNGNIVLQFKLKGERKSEIISDCEDSFIETKKTKVSFQSLICQGEKSFDMNETKALSEDKGDISKIISVSAFPSLESIKIVTGKILIKGELNFSVTYCEEGKDSFTTFKHTMPISQIVDLIGIDDKGKCKVDLKLQRFFTSVKADASGKNRLVDFSARLSAEIYSRETKDMEIVDDCFSTSYPLEAKQEDFTFSISETEIDEVKEIKKEVDFGKNINEIVLAFCPEISTKLKTEEDKAKIICSVLLCVIYKDEKGVPGFSEKLIETTFEEKLSNNKKFSGFVRGEIQNVSFKTTGKDSAQVVIELRLTGEIFREERKKVCLDMECLETEPAEVLPALTVYFPGEGEKLWDIAKKYKSPVKLIMEENKLKEDIITKKQALLIPSV